MQEQTLFAKIARGFKRDRHLSLSERLRKGVSLVSETANARLALRGADRVGDGVRLIGRPRVENGGSLKIGSGVAINSGYLPVELLTAPGGELVIEDEVWINFGCVISARQAVVIGRRAQLGPHCIVSDTELHDGSPTEYAAKPIEIGEDAWLAGRVTVMPGVKIGAGAVVTAGSIVESDIPPRVVAGGIPARVLRPLDAASTNGTDHPAPPRPATPAAAEVAPAAPALPRYGGVLISDFTIDELADELAAANGEVRLEAHVAPFGQVAQVLLSPPEDEFKDFAVAWTSPDKAVPSFGRLLAFEDVSEAELLADVDAFSQLLEQAAKSYKIVLVPTWTVPPWVRGRGMLDAREGGATKALWTINGRLVDNLARTGNVFALNAQRWFEMVGRPSSTHRAWYLGKMAVSRRVLAEAAADIRAAVAGLAGRARKLLVLDLDDTLWGGIVGDVGWEQLRLGGHDSIGEAFVDFQRAIKALKRRGIVLGLVSKNEESVALEAIRSHPEMVLKEDDFVGWKINWVDKARNIAELASELNLGLQSVVFIDDNPVERARVREALPEVFVPEWPEDKLLYPSEFHRLRCFDAPSLSREDLERTRLYAEERKRDQLQKQVGSIEEWLKSLGIVVRVEPLTSTNLGRTTQLLNKTNQLNLSTRRLTEPELSAWVENPARKLWTVSVADRFGDAGLTGIVSVEASGDEARVVDYVLSCRVMGRKVEETMVHLAVESARSLGASRVVAELLPTPKNKPCLTFWQRSGFDQQENVFTWDAQRAYELPEAIRLEWRR